MPLSIEIAFSSLADKALTSAGLANFEFNSGNKADGTWFLIFSIKSSSFLSMKKTGTLLIDDILFAKETNL